MMRVWWVVFTCVVLMGGVGGVFAQQGEVITRHEGELTTAQPTAEFEIELQADQIVTFITKPTSALDTVLRLYDGADRQVAFNDDRAQGDLNSEIIFVSPRRSTYRIQVSGYEGAVGDFLLEVRDGADLGLSDNATMLLAEGLRIPLRDTDRRVTFEAQEGDTVSISTFAVSPELDTVLTLKDPNGREVATDDDGGGRLGNSLIVYTIRETGEYTIIVGSYQGLGVGDLMLFAAVDPQAVERFDFENPPGEIVGFGRYTGTANDNRTTLDYSFQLEEGQRLVAIANTLSGELDPIISLYGSDDRLLAYNDDRGDGSLNAAVTYTVAEAGLYRIIVGRYGDTAGNFELLLRAVDEESAAAIVSLLEEDIFELSGEVIVIETENFQIFYTREGEDATIPAYAEAVADAFEETYAIQVEEMGWAEPVRNRLGRYPVYIADLHEDDDDDFRTTLGYTDLLNVVADNPNTALVEQSAASAFLVIENDYEMFSVNSQTIDQIRSTASYIFSFAIQFGYNYADNADLMWIGETTAAWAELKATDDVEGISRSAYADFEQPEACFTIEEEEPRNITIGRWTFLQSLADQFGDEVVVSLWENLADDDGLVAVEKTLAPFDISMADSFARWRAQNYARAYPFSLSFASVVPSEAVIDSAGDWLPTRGGIQELGANYFALDLDAPYHFRIDGARSLELYGLGVNGEEVDVVPLGRAGTFDPGRYLFSALMVFDSAAPQAPGDCRTVEYRITVAPSGGAGGDPAYGFSADNFVPNYFPTYRSPRDTDDSQATRFDLSADG